MPLFVIFIVYPDICSLNSPVWEQLGPKNTPQKTQLQVFEEKTHPLEN